MTARSAKGLGQAICVVAAAWLCGCGSYTDTINMCRTAGLIDEEQTRSACVLIEAECFSREGVPGYYRDPEAVDTDGDGQIDLFDEYPTDPNSVHWRGDRADASPQETPKPPG